MNLNNLPPAVKNPLKPYCCGMTIDPATKLLTRPDLSPCQIYVVCDKAYGDPRKVREHQRIHLGELDYECMMCPMKFINFRNKDYH